MNLSYEKGASPLDKIKGLSIPNYARVIVISDIHGELELLKGLPEKVNYSEKDYLIINGDLCEKGSNSKGVVSYLMKLSAHHPNVHIIEGNCDTLVEELLHENPKLIHYLCTRKHSILNEWLAYLGYAVNEETHIQEVKEILITHFSKEIKWLTELPTAIEAEDYIFVHGGLEDIDNWKDTARDTAITLPAFLDKSHQTNKYVIVGHWPVVNYSSDVSVHNPIIDQDKKIIAIDGGNVIKPTGQLNAFIIHRSPAKDMFSYTYLDHFPNYVVLEDFNAESTMIGSIHYPLYDIFPVERNENFTLCRQLETNRFLHVKNEYLKQNQRGLFTAKTDVPCAQLSVKKGDIVSVVDDSCTGYSLVKKDGMVGWIPKGILACKQQLVSAFR
ncbi:serine/threonine protein phosphatase [Bacillus pseudomycoides]|nr:serine/threonine protein phosphatase [Bacillus pseudomycoides]